MDVRLYDAFPKLIDALVTMARDAGRLPLADMDAESVAMARELIAAAVVFRDTALPAVARGVQP